jgi:hypothetical protein
LDAGLKHAELAVKLAPKMASWVDTLAEAYFARGEKELAVAAAKRALAMEPESWFLKKAVAAFEKGERRGAEVDVDE